MEHRLGDVIFEEIPKDLWRKEEFFIPGTKLGKCENCGFIHGFPYPSGEVLASYYSQYEMPTPQANLQDMARFVHNNTTSEERSGWRVVDLGCGDGKFLEALEDVGFAHLMGVDVGPGVQRAMEERPDRFREDGAFEFLEHSIEEGDQYDFISLINVVEHVPEPGRLFSLINQVLSPQGKVFSVVPNDFNPLQKVFLDAKGHPPWFVCFPDHVNYFDFKSYEDFLSRTGHRLEAASTLYPLALFLLQDLDYIQDPSLGPVAHERRLAFETNFKDTGNVEVLDRFYEELAKAGVGRAILALSTKVEQTP